MKDLVQEMEALARRFNAGRNSDPIPTREIIPARVLLNGRPLERVPDTERDEYFDSLKSRMENWL